MGGLFFFFMSNGGGCFSFFRSIWGTLFLLLWGGLKQMVVTALDKACAWCD